MRQARSRVVVCTFGSWCTHDGDTEAILMGLKQAASAAGLQGQVRTNKAGCLNQVGLSPMVVSYPQDRWYADVMRENAAALIQAELVSGEPLARGLYHTFPGDDKDLCRYPAKLVACEQARKGDG